MDKCERYRIHVHNLQAEVVALRSRAANSDNLLDEYVTETETYASTVGAQIQQLEKQIKELTLQVAINKNSIQSRATEISTLKSSKKDATTALEHTIKLHKEQLLEKQKTIEMYQQERLVAQRGDESVKAARQKIVNKNTLKHAEAEKKANVATQNITDIRSSHSAIYQNQGGGGRYFQPGHPSQQQPNHGPAYGQGFSASGNTQFGFLNVDQVSLAFPPINVSTFISHHFSPLISVGPATQLPTRQLPCP